MGKCAIGTFPKKSKSSKIIYDRNGNQNGDMGKNKMYFFIKESCDMTLSSGEGHRREVSHSNMTSVSRILFFHLSLTRNFYKLLSFSFSLSTNNDNNHYDECTSLASEREFSPAVILIPFRILGNSPPPEGVTW